MKILIIRATIYCGAWNHQEYKVILLHPFGLIVFILALPCVMLISMMSSGDSVYKGLKSLFTFKFNPFFRQ